MTCAADGCTRPKRVRDWCHMHYQRWRRHGDPAVVRHAWGGNLPPHWSDPLTTDDYQALRASVDADARRLLPFALAYIVSSAVG